MILFPKLLLSSVTEITYEILKENKINALILDVDNTLIDYQKNMPKSIEKWANTIKQKGIKLYILSNTNNKEKVENVAEILQIPYMNFAKKPFKSGFMKVQKDLQEKEQNIAVVGDQIFTDIIGGNRCKMFTILVEPIQKKEFWYTKWKRPIEEIIKNRYKELTKEKENVHK